MSNGKGSSRRPGRPGAYERGYDAIRWKSKAPALRRLDEWGQPICENCGEHTNRHYAQHFKLICWQCGAQFLPPSGCVK